MEPIQYIKIVGTKNILVVNGLFREWYRVRRREPYDTIDNSKYHLAL